ncbi:Rieske (2Fe-2S) protein [Nocardiopsis sp. MG754419]|nr:Rieske (2Fe-2S) protein [Nocardiopsis sp. MG754419]
MVGQTTDVPEGGGAVFSHSKLVVTQPEKGEYKAFSAACTHGGCTVQEVEDELIRCLCHGSEFDYVSGDPVAGPAKDPLESFTVSIDGTDIILD